MLIDPILEDWSHIDPNDTEMMKSREYMLNSREKISDGLWWTSSFNFNVHIKNKIREYGLEFDHPSEFMRNFYIKNNVKFADDIPENIHEFYLKPIPDKNEYYYGNSDPDNVIPLNEYGVCDTPEQLLEYYDFQRDPRKFCISFTPIIKKYQPKEGGWRYHKWGPYIGTQTPTCEYIADEPNIEEVVVYQIYQFLD